MDNIKIGSMEVTESTDIFAEELMDSDELMDNDNPMADNETQGENKSSGEIVR